MIQYLYSLGKDHHNKSSYHPSPYIVINIFSGDENFRDLLFSNFQKCNTVSLTIVTMLYMTSPGLISGLLIFKDIFISENDHKINDLEVTYECEI